MYKNVVFQRRMITNVYIFIQGLLLFGLIIINTICMKCHDYFHCHQIILPVKSLRFVKYNKGQWNCSDGSWCPSLRKYVSRIPRLFTHKPTSIRAVFTSLCHTAGITTANPSASGISDLHSVNYIPSAWEEPGLVMTVQVHRRFVSVYAAFLCSQAFLPLASAPFIGKYL